MIDLIVPSDFDILNFSLSGHSLFHHVPTYVSIDKTKKDWSNIFPLFIFENIKLKKMWGTMKIAGRMWKREFLL